MAKDLAFNSWQGQEIFSSLLMFRLALRATQPPIQDVPAAVSLGIKQQGFDGDRSPPSRAEVKNGGATLALLHTSSWHGA
jgi:hypothetical protein